MIIEQLDHLATLRQRLASLETEKQEAIARVLTPEQQAQCAAIAQEFTDLWAELTAQAAQLEALIKATVLHAGASVKGTALQALYVKGRTSWDSRALEGYAVAHPEITEFKKSGEPSVTIRGL